MHTAAEYNLYELLAVNIARTFKDGDVGFTGMATGSETAIFYFPGSTCRDGSCAKNAGAQHDDPAGGGAAQSRPRRNGVRAGLRMRAASGIYELRSDDVVLPSAMEL